jgi:hypothetical protein
MSKQTTCRDIPGYLSRHDWSRIGDSRQSLVKQERTRVYSIVPRKGSRNRMVDFIRDAEHTARKVHICDWCVLPILPGERYRRQTYKWEGRLVSEAWHPECLRAMQDTQDPDSDERCSNVHRRGVGCSERTC